MTIIICITADKANVSHFEKHLVEQHPKGGMLLSDQISAQNFRLRESKPGYSTDWHMAGDPTLLIIQNGTLRITLQNGKFTDFAAGEMCIAADNLPAGVAFDSSVHGHRAEVIGDEILRAVHIKLKDWELLKLAEV